MSSSPTLPSFTTFPTEIQLEILSYCGQLDLVCLSLASKYFRALTKSLVPTKPSLLAMDRFYMTWTPGQKHSHNKATKVYYGTKELLDWMSCRTHFCHEKVATLPGGGKLERRHLCYKRGCQRHCRCVSCPLYTRLVAWVPEGLKYCPKCEQFTGRADRGKYKGRCELHSQVLSTVVLSLGVTDSFIGMHGKPGARKSHNNHWTRRRTTSKRAL